MTACQCQALAQSHICRGEVICITSKKDGEKVHEIKMMIDSGKAFSAL